MSVRVFSGDCLKVLDTLGENSVDAVVCDPPYHLTSIVKRFGKANSAPAQFGTDGAFARASRGFMGKEWDGGDIAFRPETWARVLRVLKPGGHLVAFSGTRTYHRMVCAVEDAGFEVRDQLAWVFGSGFPKSHNLPGGFGTALKPAYEPIVLARKPLSEGTVAANVLRWGCGGINIDKCRIFSNNQPNEIQNGKGGESRSGKAFSRGDGQDDVRSLRASYDALGEPSEASKVAANVRQDMPSGEDEGRGEPSLERGEMGLQEVWVSRNARRYTARRGQGSFVKPESSTGEGASACDGAQVGASVIGYRDGSSHRREQEEQQPGKPLHLELGGSRQGTSEDNAGDGGVASGERATEEASWTLGRWPANLAHDGSEEVLAGFPETKSGIMRGGTTRAAQEGPGSVCYGTYGGNATDADTYGDSGSAARFFYCAKANKSDRAGSKHPTVKPVALMRWLVRMVTPPGGTVLDPFAGTGTTGQAAIEEGFDAILIEREAEYLADIERRLNMVQEEAPLLAMVAE